MKKQVMLFMVMFVGIVMASQGCGTNNDSNSVVDSSDVDVEQVSKYISDADANREIEHAKETETAKQTSEKTNIIGHSVREHQKIPVSRTEEWFSANSQNLKVLIPHTTNRTVKLSQNNSIQETDSFTVSLPNAGSLASAKVASDGSVVYLKTNKQLTDVVVQSFDDSVRILTVLNSANSPSEFSYHIDLPDGGKIQKGDHGEIVVLDSTDNLVGGFATPWAVDSNGKTIPTHYEIRGDDVIQVVEHLALGNTAYPVVADPWLFINLISSASWESNPKGFGWTLKVTPTLWARSYAGNYSVGVAGWNELYSKYQNVGRGLKINLGGMQDQYICHQHIVAVVYPTKPTWNLDEWRPDLSYFETVNNKCNPGEPGGGKIID